MPPPDDFQPRLGAWGHAWRALLALLISALLAVETYPVLWDDHRWWIAGDLALGLVALVAVHWRRRWPLGVALGTIALATVSTAAAGPSLLALVSLATRRVYWQVVVAGLASVVSAEVFYRVVPSSNQDPAWVTFTANVAAVLALLAWGMFIGSRRELLWTLRQRAERAESEQELRTGKARAEERARIAREMHDVLAHRISQVSMHAGALSFRTDLDADALRAGIGEVQQQANLALDDLRGVLGVLRDPLTGEATHRPQPTYDDLGPLVAASTAAGARVELVDELPSAPPVAVGRTLYRLVQEGITNAHKHAPGALLTIEVTGAPDDGVEVRMRNPFGFGTPSAPGAGLGLVGLTERVELAGGHLVHGREGGAFLVHAWLPWSP
ncbi:MULTISPECIES: histidine kinase [unclassified Nocardioides]|uniref:sensor histidine kinase n=1 Tax=unclassified Nocardioides TaxID=2615069 RepID=UPI002404EA34|nr:MULTISPECIES: histidine kinase [unclassified Nocardioides]